MRMPDGNAIALTVRTAERTALPDSSWQPRHTGVPGKKIPADKGLDFRYWWRTVD